MTLTSAELTGMRDAIEQLFPQTCNIITVTLTPDGMGGNTESLGTTTASCRLDVESGMEQVVGGALQPYTRSMLSLPYDTTIDEANRIEIGSNTYAVKSVNTDQGWIAVRRCELEAVDDD